MVERLERLRSGQRDNPRAHIRHLAVPVKTTQMRFDRAAEAWAAVSLSLLLFGIVGLIFLAPGYLGVGLVIITLLFIVIESILRGAFTQTVALITALLAILSSIILFFHFWFWILIGALLVAATFLMFQRLRELAG